MVIPTKVGPSLEPAQCMVMVTMQWMEQAKQASIHFSQLINGYNSNASSCSLQVLGHPIL